MQGPRNNFKDIETPLIIINRLLRKNNSLVSMIHPLSFLYPSFFIRGKKTEEWAMDTI